MIISGPNYEEMHVWSACIVREGQLYPAAAERQSCRMRCDTDFSRFRHTYISPEGDWCPR